MDQFYKRGVPAALGLLALAHAALAMPASPAPDTRDQEIREALGRVTAATAASTLAEAFQHSGIRSLEFT